MIFPLIEFLLICVFLMTLGNFWLWFKPIHKERYFYQKIIIYLNIYISIHALYVLIIEKFFPDIPYLDRLPFALLYGPFLFFIIRAQRDNKLSKRAIWINILPFCILFLWFATILVLGIPDDLVKPYHSTLGICSLLSYGGYAIWSIYYVTRKLGNKSYIRKSLLLVGFMLLLFMCSIVLAYLLSDGKLSSTDSARELFRSMVYGCMLGASYLIHSELKSTAKRENKKILRQKQTSEAKYEKSLLPPEQLDAYAKILKDLMQHDKIYLNQDLSLRRLTEITNIPPHHLTQVFNIKLGVNFHEYVNKFRIQEACILLIKQRETSIEIIAQRCGFNSKSSFNRNFKASQGCTPSEYRLSFQQQ